MASAPVRFLLLQRRRREPRPVGIGAHLEENRRTRDWRGETLGRMRKLIKETGPDIVEEWKWTRMS
jgi:hypothetical protein